MLAFNKAMCLSQQERLHLVVNANNQKTSARDGQKQHRKQKQINRSQLPGPSPKPSSLVSPLNESKLSNVSRHPPPARAKTLFDGKSLG
mmetsp:Transcript_9984/g.18378  ORF Transcript_9984/g.18378 Transcript_9984/m.18378 type:complete len:89 (+) Transcript_9984:249-515(+)